MILTSPHHMKLEIDQNQLADWIADARECRNLVFVACDLRPHDHTLANLPQASVSEERCLFLGCQLGPRMAAVAAGYFGLVFPALPGRPYNAFRHSLYNVEELFDAYDPADQNSYRACMDWLTYKDYIIPGSKPVQFVNADAEEVLARRLHDHFIEEELDQFLAGFSPKVGGKGVVAIMGGHDRKRSDPVFKQVALLARQLTLEGYLVASGGGPGLMEASNMGAYFAVWSEENLVDAISKMAVKDVSDKYSDPEWLKAAWLVRQEYQNDRIDVIRSLGVPTWFYGHEPPNVFATHIAKYFENSLREEGLLAIATHGVIFAEGNAGTVQEIFQDSCQNYYDNYGFKSPMILLGRAAWNPAPEEMSDDKTSPNFGNKPAWPLLSKLARMKNFESLLTITDDPAEALAAIRAFSEVHDGQDGSA